MNLKDLLGEAYKEGMTFDEVQTALQGKNLVDLSTGGYVDVNKYNREVNDLKNQLSSKTAEAAKGKKEADATSNADKTLIEQLQQELKSMGIENNKNGAVAKMAEATALLGIKETDTEYTTFIDNVAGLEKDTSSSIVSYFGKQIKAAYEKGKQDAVKNSLGSMGKQKLSGSEKAESVGEFGKNLAKKTGNTNTFDYFSRK